MNKKLIYFIIVLNVCLLSSQYLLTSLRATDGQLLADLDHQLQDYSLQNQQLQNSIYSTLSLEHVSKNASAYTLTPVQINFLSPNHVAAVIANP